MLDHQYAMSLHGETAHAYLHVVVKRAALPYLSRGPMRHECDEKCDKIAS